MGYKTKREIEDIFEEAILIIYDLNKPVNVSAFILSVFHYVNYLEENYVKKKFDKGFETPNKFLFILNFYFNLIEALDFTADIENRLNACQTDNDFLQLIMSSDEEFLSYLAFSKIQLTMYFKENDEESMKNLLENLQRKAEWCINDKTVYNKLPKNIKKLYSKAVHSEYKISW